ncbi:MAG: aminoacetone oxidase family FAD-binding enzyme, partial [Bacteroidales bacterium]|nr:aminoacetone oxidase family FAD-binding enzyme [Bacteroidales bacterium]
LSHCTNGKTHLRTAFSFFSNKDTISTFEKWGLPLMEERGQRAFPKSGKSIDVFFTLLSRIENSRNVRVVCNKGVERLLICEGRIKGVICQNQERFYANKVLVCCGGESYPATGSDGDGIRIAANSGHKITDTMPALVGLRTRNAHPARLQNYTVKNVDVTILNSSNDVVAKDFGDIYLDEYGLSGPAILRLNRKIADRIYKGERLFVSVDIKPKLSEIKLRSEIVAVLNERMGQTIENVLRAWLPKELVEDYKFWLKKRKEECTRSKIRLTNVDFILEYLKHNRDEIIGDMGWYEAIVTKGGVDLSQIDCSTMQSKKVKGLFFAGEVLDFDGDTGGFNLQIAFSTAALAVKNMC